MNIRLSFITLISLNKILSILSILITGIFNYLFKNVPCDLVCEFTPDIKQVNV